MSYWEIINVGVCFNVCDHYKIKFNQRGVDQLSWNNLNEDGDTVTE